MTAAGTMPVKPAIAPAHIEVQHVLIGFAGSVPGKGITRTKEEAMKLAHEILDKARKGANFDSLVAKYTDDSPPGIYKMAADGVPPQLGEYGRRQMVPAFGNVGFAISPGNIDIAEYDPTTSPFGWHIIKRLR
jgi:parvulin-like peptidyl-prolyl isomerase